MGVSIVGPPGDQGVMGLTTMAMKGTYVCGSTFLGHEHHLYASMCFHQNSTEASLEVKPLYKHCVHIVELFYQVEKKLAKSKAIGDCVAINCNFSKLFRQSSWGIEFKIGVV